MAFEGIIIWNFHDHRRRVHRHSHFSPPCDGGYSLTETLNLGSVTPSLLFRRVIFK